MHCALCCRLYLVFICIDQWVVANCWSRIAKGSNLVKKVPLALLASQANNHEVNAKSAGQRCHTELANSVTRWLPKQPMNISVEELKSKLLSVGPCPRQPLPYVAQYCHPDCAVHRETICKTPPHHTVQVCTHTTTLHCASVHHTTLCKCAPIPPNCTCLSTSYSRRPL